MNWRALTAVLGSVPVAVGVAVAVAPSAPALGPTTPPAAVCGNLAPGPATAPAGAVTVNPAIDADVANKTDANPAGTTFWLAPGVHTLGTSEFGQIIPKDGNVYLGAPGAIIDGRNVNRYAFTQHARNVSVKFLEIRGFTAPPDEGVVNHDSGDGWVIESDNIHHNHGGGLMAGANQQVLKNCLTDNGQYAMNAFQAGNNITGLIVDGNEIARNNADNLEATLHCGCTGGVKFWAVNGADVRNNWVHDNHGAGLWADTNNNDFVIENNLIEHNDNMGIFYEISYNAIIRNNTLKDNAWVQGRDFANRADPFTIGAIYLSEADGDSRLPSRSAGKIDIYGNDFVNNWAGIAGWENADRFCNSPNSTTSDCTRIVGMTSTPRCAQPGIATEPLYSDCRWKTQNVDVHNNTFVSDPAAIDGGCPIRYCGRQAVFSNFGTSPTWSPYKGDVIQQAITYSQNNRWHDNTYTGTWSFSPFDPSRYITAAQWQAAPYSQDAGSTFETPPPPSTTATTVPPPTATTVPPPPPAVTIETADFEQSTENHIAWFTSKVTRSTSSPISGAASLIAQASAGNGSGVQLSNQPGYSGVEPGRAYDFSLKYREATATMPTVTWTIEWTMGSGTVIQSNTIAMPRSTAVAAASGRFTAPAGATNVRWTFTWTTAKSGPAFRIDDLSVKTAPE